MNPKINANVTEGSSTVDSRKSDQHVRDVHKSENTAAHGGGESRCSDEYTKTSNKKSNPSSHVKRADVLTYYSRKTGLRAY